MPQNLPLGTYTEVEVSQMPKFDQQYQYKIKINDKVVYSERNTKAQTFFDVSLYISNPWRKAARVRIRTLSFTNYLP